ncbi:MAG: hypothetical protein QXR97_05090 [Thermoproteota archaeon]
MRTLAFHAVALGAKPDWLSSLNSVGVISSVISIPAGWLIDKYDVKKILATGLALCTACAFITLGWFTQKRCPYVLGT